MRFGRVIAAIAILIALAGVSGCAGEQGHYDYEFQRNDGVGQWKSTGRTPAVTLDLRNDGTFTASGWPRKLYCDGAIPDPGGDLERLWDERIDFSGTWKVGEEGAEYVVWFLSVGSECRSNWGAVAWTDAGESPRLRVDLSPLTPSEELTDEQVLYLEKN